MSKGLKSHLSDEQMMEAVTLFAQGLHRGRVVAEMIDSDETLQKMESERGKAFRDEVCNQLRSADPNSKHFAVTKFKTHYELHKKAVLETLKNRYHTAIMQNIEFISDEIETLKEQIAELDHMLSDAVDVEPQSTTEYLQTVNARNAAAKRIAELQDKLFDRVDKIRLTDTSKEG